MKFNKSTFGQEIAEKIVAFLNGKGIDASITKDHIVIDDTNITSIPDDLFDLGMDFGMQREREKWIKPGIIYLPKGCSEILMQVVKQYAAAIGIPVDSISSKTDENQVEITIKPILAIHLFNIATRYGREIQKNTKAHCYKK